MFGRPAYLTFRLTFHLITLYISPAALPFAYNICHISPCISPTTSLFVYNTCNISLRVLPNISLLVLPSTSPFAHNTCNVSLCISHPSYFLLSLLHSPTSSISIGRTLFIHLTRPLITTLLQQFLLHQPRIEPATLSKMAQIPTQPAASWYTAEPLRGTGKGGNLVELDFIAALQITKDTYHEIRSACVRQLDEYADNARSKVDLRTLWSGASGGETRKTMIDDLTQQFRSVFVDTTRFSLLPTNWTKVSRALAEQCLVVANAARSRAIRPVRKGRESLSPTPSTAVSERPTSIADSAPSTPDKPSRQSSRSLPPVDQLTFASAGVPTLNSVAIPVAFNGQTEDIAAWLLRPDSKTLEEPQYCQDVTLEKFVHAFRGEFMHDGPIQIYALNSVGGYRAIKNDQHLQTSITRWLHIYNRTGESPPNFFEVRSATEADEQGKWCLYVHISHEC